MKRFLCTVCQKVKRVRVLPSNVEHADSDNPLARHGQCNWHDPQFKQKPPVKATNRTRGKTKRKSRK